MKALHVKVDIEAVNSSMTNMKAFDGVEGFPTFGLYIENKEPIKNQE